ncbi:MAG: response regulator, partial [Sandaracinaceae bacterium]|nr:response regulator [Sandaracinaceae bacterium]
RHVAWGIAVGFGGDETLDLLNPAFARMHGYAVEELAGLPVAQVFAPEEHEAMKAAIARVDETGHHGWEAMHVRKDGSRFPAAMDAVMVRDFAGAPLYRIMSVKDISERRKAQDEVKESERLLVRAQKLEALGTLAGGVAHDFNNILVAIRGSAALAADELSAEHPVHSLLTEIEQAGKRATGLVTQILSFARPEEPSRAPVDLRALVDEAIRFLRAAIPARIELRTHYSEDLPRAVVDANQVHQVIVNVVTNGFHAIGDGAGSVVIQLDEVTMSADDAGDVAPGPYVRVAVSDDGCGMDPQTLAKCCDPFFTTKAPGKGTGLGLSIVHGIMKSHRGALRIRSELGQGTVITLLFPVALPAHETAAPNQRSIARQRHAACRVIVVDDDPAVGRLTKRYLVREGYSVTLAVDPVEAITHFEEAPGAFDAIITDLSMPRMSGFELVRRARLVRPEIPVIVTTGYLGIEDEETARRLGVNGIIKKPETLDQLVLMLEQVVAVPTATRASGPVST